MEAHHYPGALAKIRHTLWYVASWNGQWLALLSFSAAAWKRAARDAWIGWGFATNPTACTWSPTTAGFLILPEYHVANLASRLLALSERRLASDWRERFGYPLLLLETFFDPRRFHGTIYRAANWRYVGDTRGYRRTRTGYSAELSAAKHAFVRPLHAQAKTRLCRLRYSVPTTVMDPERHAERRTDGVPAGLLCRYD
jgi:hypothetical protein